jgi:hypothetical protein
MKSSKISIGICLKSLVVLLAIHFAPAAGASDNAATLAIHPAQPVQEALFRDWLLSRCIARSDNVGALPADAHRAAAFYAAKSRLPAGAFTAGDALIDRFLDRPFRGPVEGSYHTVACIDLYQSGEARRLFDRFAAQLEDQ